jgi:hypothetical protein
MNATRNPHDRHLALCWKICRFGVQRIEDPELKARVLSWIERMRGLFPGSPHLALWDRVVRGEEPEAAPELGACADYFALSSERRSWWRPLIQSHPFACVIPGRTTRERRAVLSRLP